MNRNIWRIAGLAVACVLLAGCTNFGDYYKSVDAANARQVDLERARAEAEAMRYQALMRIAESGDATAKVAAVMALSGLQQNVGQSRMAVPAQPQNEALQWASILVPTAGQLGQTWLNGRVQMNASDNSTRLGLSTNDTFKHFASEISKPPVIVDPVIVEPPPYNDPIIVPPFVVDPIIVPVPQAPAE